VTPVFDVIAGLPVHALVVHAVVVLLPLMAVVTFVVALRPAWRRGPVARWVALADLIVVGIAYVARLSGKNLQARLSALQGPDDRRAARQVRDAAVAVRPGPVRGRAAGGPARQPRRSCWPC
jgi:uncharacterized membrane protein